MAEAKKILGVEGNEVEEKETDKSEVGGKEAEKNEVGENEEKESEVKKVEAEGVEKSEAENTEAKPTGLTMLPAELNKLIKNYALLTGTSFKELRDISRNFRNAADYVLFEILQGKILDI
jgi:hypothetical protein